MTPSSMGFVKKVRAVVVETSSKPVMPCSSPPKPREHRSPALDRRRDLCYWRGIVGASAVCNIRLSAVGEQGVDRLTLIREAERVRSAAVPAENKDLLFRFALGQR